MSNYNIPPTQYHRQQQPVTINPWTLSAASPNQDLALANKMQNLEERKKAALEFIESILGETLSVSSTGNSNSDGDKFWKALKDGVVLCRFMNKLQPDSIPKISLKPLPFTQMENISNFLQAAQKFGVETSHMFQTVDLYEAKDLSQVTITLLAIQRILKEGKPKPQLVQPNSHSHPPQVPANPSRTAKTPGAPSAHSTVLPNDVYSNYTHQMPSANQHSQGHHTQNQRPQSMVLPQSSASSQRQNQQYRQSIAVAEELTKMSLSEPAATASHSSNLKLPTTQGNNAGSSDAQEKDKKSPASATGNTLVRMENGVEVATYLIGNCIGKGNFGTVYKAINIETNQTFAIKKIPLDARAKKEVEKLKKEVKVFQKLSHPNIVHYEGFVQTEDDFNIILEYVENGSLAHTLKNFGPLPEKMVVNNVIKICEGLGYLHEHGLMHLDLKAANILTTKNGEVKLSDFGVSLAINGSYTENERFVGTAYWMAPEIIELRGPTPASDIWSLGCTIIELVTGKPPYSELLTMAALFRIVEDDMPPLPEDLSKELKDFLMKCFNKDPSKRWSAKRLLEHEWLEPHVKRMKPSQTGSNNSLLSNIANSTLAPNIYQPTDEQQFMTGGMGMQVPQRTVAKGIPASLIEQQLAQKNSMFAGPSLQSNYMATPQNRQTMLMNFNQSPMALGNQQLMYNQDGVSSSTNGNANSAAAILHVPKSNANIVSVSTVSGTGTSGNGTNAGAGIHQQQQQHTWVKSVFSKSIQCKLCSEKLKKKVYVCSNCGLLICRDCVKTSETDAAKFCFLSSFASHNQPQITLSISQSQSPSSSNASVNSTAATHTVSPADSSHSNHFPPSNQNSPPPSRTTSTSIPSTSPCPIRKPKQKRKSLSNIVDSLPPQPQSSSSPSKNNSFSGSLNSAVANSNTSINHSLSIPLSNLTVSSSSSHPSLKVNGVTIEGDGKIAGSESVKESINYGKDESTNRRSSKEKEDCVIM